ncbi:uncharacterized protein LOC130291530 isoform X2 [Hyla sarda]|uniref:uncharacterized protein LOC130291530 isoform X2 n=1 Tax=Hyla sarda TaxID=327740 RepID=UPI0024C220AC|nr:uncharacterized protein LOC130291530 isoform X2 [Hyla sarda]
MTSNVFCRTGTKSVARVSRVRRKPGSGQAWTRKGASSSLARSPPFSRSELEYMVKYLDEQNFDSIVSVNPYKKKTKIMLKLSKNLKTKFGTVHNRRQLQKRYSDLKVHQKQLLRNIRERIVRQTGTNSSEEDDDDQFVECPNFEESQIIDPEKVYLSLAHETHEEEADPLEITQNTPAKKNPEEILSCEDQMITLNLVEIPTYVPPEDSQFALGNEVNTSTGIGMDVLTELSKIKENLQVQLAKVDMFCT